MARVFDDASSEYLEVSSAVASSTPLAFACWFRPDDGSATQALFSIATAGSDDNYLMLLLRGTDQNVEAHARGTLSKVADTTTSWSTNTWHHAAGVWLSSSERHVYLDAGGKGSNTDSVTPSGMDTTSIGRLNRSSSNLFMSGRIAEAGLWDLTDWGGTDAARETAFEAALTSLASGYSPLLYQTGLLDYWPLIGRYSPEIDVVRGNDLTVTGASAAVHTRVFSPSRNRVLVPSTAASAASVGRGLTTSQKLGRLSLVG